MAIGSVASLLPEGRMEEGDPALGVHVQGEGRGKAGLCYSTVSPGVNSQGYFLLSVKAFSSFLFPGYFPSFCCLWP